MASNPKLDSSSSSPDGVPYGSQRSNYSNNSNLERSGNNRDGHDGGRLGLGAGGGVGAANTPGAGGGGGTELPPLSQVLLLEPLTVGEQRAGRHSELKRAINAAVGSVLVEDPSLGSVQSKPLEACGPEDLRRIKASLQDHVGKARERKRHLVEAINKLDRFRNSLQSRKRSRPESSASGPSGPSAERSLSSLGVGDRTVASVHNMKSNSNAALPHSVATAEVTMQKAVDKNKRVVPNKRVRTSMADTRPDGRPANLNLQRPSVSTERERDVTRVTPSNSLPSPAEEKERVVVAPPSEGREKTKMKGRRSGSTTKPDAAVVAVPNGTSEGSDREHKWSGQQHRMNADNRSRPSEGHGFRSGPVHGITSVHKAESTAQINGLPARGGSKSESEGTPAVPERAERVSIPDRERTVSKNGIKPPPSREESHPGNIPGVTKAKAARAPRSISFGGGGPSSHLARSSSFSENRERHPPPAKAQGQSQPPTPAPAPVPAPTPTPTPAPSGPTNRKRPAPSRSSSPPAQWVGQRPQKMARVARRVNVMPGATVTREETNVVAEGSVTREAVAANTSARPSPGVPTGSGVARRVSGSTIHSQPTSKPKSERVTPSVGLSESDESEDDGEKAKEKVKKQADWEQKPTPPSQKMACLVVPAKKTRVVTKEEGGDGVRRQGRSGRGAVAPRTSVVNPVEKVEVFANATQLRSVRAGSEKVDRIGGRPPTKKDSVDRKPMTRPRRPVGNGLSEISGESDDDREELANAIKMALNASELACSNSFWKQMEPYFAFLTSADLVFLRQQARDLEEGDPAMQIPPCGGQQGKTESMISSPPVSPTVDPGGGKSMSLANGNIETDGSVTKLFHNMKEKHEVGKGGKRGVSGGWLDKILPLSQRLLAAVLNEGDVEEGRRGGEENCQDDSSEGHRDESPFRGSLSGSERVDGDSDGDVGRRDLERWNSGGREVYMNEGLLLPNGHGSRSGLAIQREDLGGEGDDILAAAEEDAMNSADQLEMGNGDEVLAGSGIAGKEDRGNRSTFGTVAGMTAWETQYQRMTVDERIMLELQSIGLFPEPVQPDLTHREDDEISEELRKLQRELKEQVSANKERVSNLEKIVLLKKEKEERDRERFAVEKLVEKAYSRRMGSRGSAGKSAAAKGAKSAGLAFAKRVLARVRAYEGGQSIFDASLKDLLFCVAPKESESSVALSGGVEGIAPATSLTGEAAAVTSSALQPPKPAAPLSNEVSGVRPPVVRRTDVKSEKDIPDSRQQPNPLADRGRVKEDGWPLRAKEREVLLEDAVGVSGMRDVNALGANVMGGTKGKRSERDRDGKGHGKESHARSDSSKGSRQEAGSVKPERKTKTKPRQKTAPLTKAVKGLLAKPSPEPVKDRTTASSSSQQSAGPAKSKEEVPVVPPLSAPGPIPEPNDVVDLSDIPLPGIEDLGVNDLGGQGQDLGAWLQDFDEDAHMNTDGDCLMGLQVPMDDLSDLGLMM
ncbi:unnamed protein product [Calypogeia fissa]